MNHLRVSAALLMSLLLSAVLQAQRPNICASNARMELACPDACIICDIDGFSGRNSTQGQGDFPSGFCTSVNHNIQWIGFLAGSTELTLELSVFNCEAGSRPDGGLEAGVFEVVNCELSNAVAMSNCDSDISNNSSQLLTMDRLVPGRYYYLVIDGNNGDVCDYRIRVTRGSTRIPEVRSSGGLRGPQRICENRDFNYEISPVAGAIYYDWTLDGDTLRGGNDLQRDLRFAAPGTYQLCITASNLCSTGPTECLSIQVGDVAPTVVDIRRCDGESLQLHGSTIQSSGDYPFRLSNSVGCDSTVLYRVIFEELYFTALDTSICAGLSYWFAGRELSQNGLYLDTLRSAAGCDSIVQLDLRFASCGFEVETRVGAVSCFGESDGRLEMRVTGPAAPYQLRWGPASRPDSVSQVLDGQGTWLSYLNLRGGSYFISVTDSFGVEELQTIEIPEPERLSSLLRPTRYGDFEISCHGAADAEINVSVFGGTSPYEFLWSDGDRQAQREGLSPGLYRVEILDGRGCRREDSLLIREPEPLFWSGYTSDAPCGGSGPGYFHLTSLGGGQAPYLFEIDGEQLGMRPGDSLALEPGTFEVLLRDENGCRFRENQQVYSPNLPSVKIEAQQVIQRGDTLRLVAEVSDDVLSYAWTSDTWISCTDCPDPWSLPQETGIFQVEVANESGCVASAELKVLVRQIRKLLAPDAFSPNGDGNNDLFFLRTTEAGVEIELFQVYDRWGGLMYSLGGFPAGESQYGWDGTFRGERMPPGVYAFVAEAVWPNGVSEVVTGSILLMN